MFDFDLALKAFDETQAIEFKTYNRGRGLNDDQTKFIRDTLTNKSYEYIFAIIQNDEDANINAEAEKPA